MKSIYLLILITISSITFAEESPFSNESEFGLVITDGNSISRSINAKQANKYTFSQNIFKFNGAYLKTISNGAESARKWNLGVRYERELSSIWSTFVGQNVESDIFAGFRQRYNTDVGAKYIIIKNEETNWISEAGYRYSYTNTMEDKKTKNHYARLFSEVNQQWNKSFSTKLWAEYLPNFTVTTAWKLNSELSISAMMTSVFSLKTSYLVNYDHEPAKATAVKTDSTLTTALVAKF